MDPMILILAGAAILLIFSRSSTAAAGMKTDTPKKDEKPPETPKTPGGTSGQGTGYDAGGGRLPEGGGVKNTTEKAKDALQAAADKLGADKKTVADALNNWDSLFKPKGGGTSSEPKTFEEMKARSSATPTPGKYYQIRNVTKVDDSPSALSKAAYGDSTKWRKIRDHAWNAWIKKASLPKVYGTNEPVIPHNKWFNPPGWGKDSNWATPAAAPSRVFPWVYLPTREEVGK